MTVTDFAGLEAERDFLLQSLRDLEREHATGALTDDEYGVLRDEQTARAAEVLRALQREPEVIETKGPRTRRFEMRRKALMWTAAAVVFAAVAAGTLVTKSGDRLTGQTATGGVADDPNSLVRQAQDLTAKGKAFDAVKTYDRALALDPKNVQALTYRGWLVRLAGLSDQGLASIDQAIAIQPDYPDAHFFKGFILFRDHNDPHAAIPEFQTFLADNPPQDMVPLVQQALQDARAEASATLGQKA